MSFKAGDQVVVDKPTAGLPAFKVSGRIYTVDFVTEELGEQMLHLKNWDMSWSASRFSKFETKQVN